MKHIMATVISFYIRTNLKQNNTKVPGL